MLQAVCIRGLLETDIDSPYFGQSGDTPASTHTVVVIDDVHDRLFGFISSTARRIAWFPPALSERGSVFRRLLRKSLVDSADVQYRANGFAHIYTCTPEGARAWFDEHVVPLCSEYTWLVAGILRINVADALSVSTEFDAETQHQFQMFVDGHLPLVATFAGMATGTHGAQKTMAAAYGDRLARDLLGPDARDPGRDAVLQMMYEHVKESAFHDPTCFEFGNSVLDQLKPMCANAPSVENFLDISQILLQTSYERSSRMRVALAHIFSKVDQHKCSGRSYVDICHQHCQRSTALCSFMRTMVYLMVSGSHKHASVRVTFDKRLSLFAELVAPDDHTANMNFLIRWWKMCPDVIYAAHSEFAVISMLAFKNLHEMFAKDPSRRNFNAVAVASMDMTRFYINKLPELAVSYQLELRRLGLTVDSLCTATVYRPFLRLHMENVSASREELDAENGADMESMKKAVGADTQPAPDKKRRKDEKTRNRELKKEAKDALAALVAEKRESEKTQKKKDTETSRAAKRVRFSETDAPVGGSAGAAADPLCAAAHEHAGKGAGRNSDCGDDMQAADAEFAHTKPLYTNDRQSILEMYKLLMLGYAEKEYMLKNGGQFPPWVLDESEDVLCPDAIIDEYGELCVIRDFLCTTAEYTVWSNIQDAHDTTMETILRQISLNYFNAHKNNLDWVSKLKKGQCIEVIVCEMAKVYETLWRLMYAPPNTTVPHAFKYPLDWKRQFAQIDSFFDRTEPWRLRSTYRWTNLLELGISDETVQDLQHCEDIYHEPKPESRIFLIFVNILTRSFAEFVLVVRFLTKLDAQLQMTLIDTSVEIHMAHVTALRIANGIFESPTARLPSHAGIVHVCPTCNSICTNIAGSVTYNAQHGACGIKKAAVDLSTNTLYCGKSKDAAYSHKSESRNINEITAYLGKNIHRHTGNMSCANTPLVALKMIGKMLIFNDRQYMLCMRCGRLAIFDVCLYAGDTFVCGFCEDMFHQLAFANDDIYKMVLAPYVATNEEYAAIITSVPELIRSVEAGPWPSWFTNDAKHDALEDIREKGLSPVAKQKREIEQTEMLQHQLGADIAEQRCRMCYDPRWKSLPLHEWPDSTFDETTVFRQDTHSAHPHNAKYFVFDDMSHTRAERPLRCFHLCPAHKFGAFDRVFRGTKQIAFSTFLHQLRNEIETRAGEGNQYTLVCVGPGRYMRKPYKHKKR